MAVNPPIHDSSRPFHPAAPCESSAPCAGRAFRYPLQDGAPIKDRCERWIARLGCFRLAGIVRVSIGAKAPAILPFPAPNHRRIPHRPPHCSSTMSNSHHLPPRLSCSQASRESMPQSWGLPPSLEVSTGLGAKSALVSPASWRSSTRRFFAWVRATGPRRGPSTTASRPPPR